MPALGIRCRGLIDDNNVEATERGFMLPKRFSDGAFDLVACRRLATMLLGYRETEPSRAVIVLPAKYGKPFVTATCRLFKHVSERGRIQKPVVFSKPVRGAAFQSW